MHTLPPAFAEPMLPENIGAHIRSSLALTLWREQIDAGLGEPGETADDARVSDWMLNRTYPPERLDDAIAEIRAEAGLPVIC